MQRDGLISIFFLDTWSSEALEAARDEMRNITDKDMLIIKRIGHMDKSIEDISRIQAGRDIKYNYFKPEHLPRMVTIEEAKKNIWMG